MELTVLGCSGSYGAPAGGACSGYLVRAGDATIWMDCGNGSFVNLQQHADPGDSRPSCITHGHPDHCVDLYGLHVMYKYGLERHGLPVYAPEGIEETLSKLVAFGDAFEWNTVADGDKVEIADTRRSASRAPTIRRRPSRSRSSTTPSVSCTPPTPDRDGASMRSARVPTSCSPRRRTCTTTSVCRSTSRRARPASSLEAHRRGG